MAEATLERASCESCGATVRDNTQFCYNCGKRYVDARTEINGLGPTPISDEARTALDDLAAKLSTDEADSDDKLARAAAKRKIARIAIAPKKSGNIAWEADDTRSGLFMFIFSLFIFLLVAAVVFLTVYWK